MTRTEKLFTGALRAGTVLSALCVMAYAATMIYNRHEINLTESVVTAHSTMLARGGTLYYSLKTYPYTACGYTPVFYGVEAALVRAGVLGELAGRWISFSALLASFWLAWRIVGMYTGNRYAAWMAAILASASAPLLGWGTTGVVDYLGVALGMAAFWQFSRFYLQGEKTLWWAALFIAASFFTKQSMLAAPAAIFVLLLSRSAKTAVVFGAPLAAAIAGMAVGLNALTEGRFFQNTVFAMIQPYEAGKVMQHVSYIGLVSGALIVVFLLTLPWLTRGRSAPLLVYFLFSWLLLAVMAPKTGSDSNYHIEPTLVLIMCASAGLKEMGFFELVFANSKNWITLLQAPVAVFLLMNYRVVAPDLVTRLWREGASRGEYARVEPYLEHARGPIFSADLDPVVRAKGRLDVEPIIYSLMVKTGRIDPEPMRADLARGALPVVILYEDIDHPIEDKSLEIGRLIPAHAAELRGHYRLVEHIPGPYLGGVYVYLPK